MISEPNMKDSNIWQEAVRQKIKESTTNSKQKCLIVVGSASSGKTSFLKILRNQAQTETKPTSLLQYSYIRKGHARRQLMHCYQISSKSQIDILPQLLNKDNLGGVMVAVCLDLSRPASIIQEVNQWLGLLRSSMNEMFHDKVGVQEKYKELQAKQTPTITNHQDSKLITNCPFNLTFVACKFDLYQKYDTQNRKWLSKALRYLAHINYSNLLFCSLKNVQVGEQIRSAFHDLMFQERPKLISQKDYLKAIFIYRGQDSVNSIGVQTSGNLTALDVLKKQMLALFGAQQQKKKQGIDTTKYNQHKIDNLIQQKRKQLAKITKTYKNTQNRRGNY